MCDYPHISKEHYFENYDTKERWMSYWYQINEVLNTGKRTALEVGVGNKTVANYLKAMGLTVVTVDNNPRLDPDYVCSVTELTEYFSPRSFGTVLCAEVLEHLPFSDFEKSLEELHEISREWVILSLPYAGPGFCLSLKLPSMSRKDLKLKVPLRREHKFDGQHYWEIGEKGYQLDKIKEIIRGKFKIVKSYYPAEHMYHVFFVLRRD